LSTDGSKDLLKLATKPTGVGVRALTIKPRVVMATGKKLINQLKLDDPTSRLTIQGAFSPDGRLIAAGTHKGEVILWSLFEEIPLVCLRGHRGPGGDP
jgi:WD40 repeat protein